MLLLYWLFPASLASVVLGGSRPPKVLQVDPGAHSLNVSTCPGYTLTSLRNLQHGLTAQLNLAGPSAMLLARTLQTSRLHVNIFDTAARQFTLPSTFFSRPTPPSDSTPSLVNTSDLVFNYESSPFAFWITRRGQEGSDAVLFDTRQASLPSAPVPAYNTSDSRTAFDGFPLVFEDQYLQLTSALPLNTNIYGLGEAVAASGFRRDISVNGTLQTLWARDIGDPVDENLYGSHAVYLEHRLNTSTNTSSSHGVFLNSAAGADIFLATPQISNGSETSLVQYRVLGGTLDLYFLSGPDPVNVVEQYSEVVGTPAWVPRWGFGFHLCRWGYTNLSETREQVENMRAANVPLEVMWNDIDLYHSLRDFTTDPVSFPGDQMRDFIANLTANNQHYIPILDAAINHIANNTDVYDPFTRGSEHYTDSLITRSQVFPDWFAPNAEGWWTEALSNWTHGGVKFSGLWLDMNEVSSFCDGSCGTGADLSNTSVPVTLPGDPDSPVTDYPEGYNPTISGPSGNLTINGTLTYGAGDSSIGLSRRTAKRGLGAGGEEGVDLNSPPYAIHNGFGNLSIHTIATNSTHFGGYVELDTHNVWGYMEERATNLALRTLQPGNRPFLISRSTFPGSGRWSGHWLGDNYSKWAYMRYSIQGVLQFQLFQIPMVGADTCGFAGNTDEELCNRWMQLSAFTPFFRNHNQRGALSQEPYRWDSVANASRTAIAVRYSLLPYWSTLFANASIRGTPPIRPLFFEFPNQPELFGQDEQFLVGRDILVTPVLTPNVSSVTGFLPGGDNVVWRDWYTHAAVNSSSEDGTSGSSVSLDAPLGHIPVHIRSGAALLLHAQPGYTTAETAASPYALLVALDKDGTAFGTAFVDDGETLPADGDVPPSRTLTFIVEPGRLTFSGNATGGFIIPQPLGRLTVLGVTSAPANVSVGGTALQAGNWTYDTSVQRLTVDGLQVDFNQASSTVEWA
ncbi:glycosyl hydrolases family 31-domain-containing protein [Gloeopeniophorella convolvens]|nr:glycosyl hydrolases family 31-domain-containing protein [Gloeopeniophorella convolvens]